VNATSTIWLEEFQQWLDDNRDPHEGAARLRQYLEDRPEDTRRDLQARAFEILLQERHAYGVALLMMETVQDPEYIEEIARTMAPLPRLQSADEEAHLADLVRLLAASGRRHALRVVEAFLLDRPFSAAWPTVPWALWPRHAVLFRRAWSRWILETESGRWTSDRFLGPFLTEPEAVVSIREALFEGEQAGRRDRWLELVAALQACARRTRWLQPDQRAALSDALS